MRIDKYLWCIRVFKTRSIATGQLKLDKIWVNNELVKASRELKVGDTIKIRKGPVHFYYTVIDFPKTRVGAKLVAVYAKDVTPEDEVKKLEMLKLQFKNERQRGLGRPTKKERRELDDYKDFSFEEEDED